MSYRKGSHLWNLSLLKEWGSPDTILQAKRNSTERWLHMCMALSIGGVEIAKQGFNRSSHGNYFDMLLLGNDVLIEGYLKPVRKRKCGTY